MRGLSRNMAVSQMTLALMTITPSGPKSSLGNRPFFRGVKLLHSHNTDQYATRPNCGSDFWRTIYEQVGQVLACPTCSSDNFVLKQLYQVTDAPALYCLTTTPPIGLRGLPGATSFSKGISKLWARTSGRIK